MLAYTEKTRRWKDEVMERGKAVYHSTHSPLVVEGFEHVGTAEDYVPTHDLALKKYSTKSWKVTEKPSGGRNLAFQHSHLQLHGRLMAVSQPDLLFFPWTKNA